MSRTLVAITGVNGFIGRRLAERLLLEGHRVLGIARRPLLQRSASLEIIQVREGADKAEWTDALRGVDVVVHLAARTHAVSDRGVDNLAEYRRANVETSSRLAAAAVSSSVRRLIFVSSIKVNGERTSDRPFQVGDPPAPEDAYGISKWEAEQVIADIAGAALETVVIRPPLVYGPRARGNFARLCQAVRRGGVFPLGAVKNRRSLVALDNLVDLIACCVSHGAAAGHTFLVSDGEDLSTPELIRGIARAAGQKARLIAVPPNLLRIVGRVTGHGAEVGRLLDSLQVDIAHTRRTLGWRPAISVAEGLSRAVVDA